MTATHRTPGRSGSAAEVPDGAGSGPATGTSRRREGPRTSAAAVLSVLAPALLSAALCLPFLGRTPLFRDEAATLSAAGRPLQELLELLGNIDLVHGLYYLVMHGWLLVSTDTAWIRLPGALATVGAVAATSVLALRLGGPVPAAVSGTLVAGNTLVVHQALVARSYPAVLLLTASLALVTFRMLQQPTPLRTAAATVLGVLAALTHLFAGGLPAAALLGAAVLVAAQRGQGRGRGRALAPFLVPFAATSAAMLVLGAAASGSAGVQLAWLDRPALAAPLHSLYTAHGGRLATWLVLALAAAAVVVHRRKAFVWLLVAWGTAGPAFLMAFSLLVSPVYVTNYVIASMPPLAVLAAVGLGALPLPSVARVRDAGPAVLGLGVAALVLAAGAPFASEPVRDDDARTIAGFVARHTRPGDVVVYTGDSARPLFQRYLAAAAPRPPRDVLLVESPEASDTLQGRTADPRASRRLAAAPRVWLLATMEDGDWPRTRPAQRAALAAVTRDRAPSLTRDAGTTRGTLFVRPGAAR